MTYAVEAYELHVEHDIYMDIASPSGYWCGLCNVNLTAPYPTSGSES